MGSQQHDLQTLYQRDLTRLIQNIEVTPDDLLWVTPDGVTNSCGVLAQHLVGNINHFVGKVLWDTGYERDREREFTATHTSKEELIKDIEQLKDLLNDIFEELENEQLDDEYPLDIPFDTSSVRGFLIHLYGHLNYHLGQVNYLRRIMAENG